MFLKKSHFRLQTVFCIHIRLRVEALNAKFCSFRGGGGGGGRGFSRETNCVRFAGLLRTFAMAPKNLNDWSSGQTTLDFTTIPILSSKPG